MIVSVDLGNKNIKTPELLFLTGLDSYDSNPSTTFFRNDCIQYEGKYYTVGSHRIEYTRFREDDIDNLIKNRTLPSNLAAIQTKVLDTLDTMALQYLKRGIKTFIEDKIDLKMYTSVFVGGASLIFKPYILQLQEEGLLGKVIFIEDVHANAKGAQILYKSAKSLMNKQ